MNLYSVLVSLHVLAAILGLGPLTVLAVSTSWSPSLPADRIAQLMRIVRGSLIGVFLTGAGIIALTHGALGETLWMRAAFALFVVLGLLHVFAAHHLRRARLVTPFVLPAGKLRGIFWTMGLVLAAITYLMEAKPW